MPNSSSEEDCFRKYFH
uniref:Uncharacterized protein n=1 Tax=Arundo donax TaxID=35708 RepID=A0A0A9A524_ARUDO